jgi:hypothetical protein
MKGLVHQLLLEPLQLMSIEVITRREGGVVELGREVRVDYPEFWPLVIKFELDTLEEYGVEYVADTPGPPKDSVSQNQLDLLALPLNPSPDREQRIEHIHGFSGRRFFACPLVATRYPLRTGLDAAWIVLELQQSALSMLVELFKGRSKT